MAMSLVPLLLPSQNTGVVRILRALRILRLFRRVPSLRKVPRPAPPRPAPPRPAPPLVPRANGDPPGAGRRCSSPDCYVLSAPQGRLRPAKHGPDRGVMDPRRRQKAPAEAPGDPPSKGGMCPTELRNAEFVPQPVLHPRRRATAWSPLAGSGRAQASWENTRHGHKRPGQIV